jgi:peptidoglycan hydrolase-like protein with peptidoglycan-binding domain
VSNVSSMNDMFNGVNLSTTNYDALITKWSALALKSNVIFDGGNSTYCTSITQRASIISTYGWTITDGGTTCSTTVSSRSSHSTAQSRVQNLLAVGNTQAADAIIKQFPDQFNSLDKVVQLCAPDRLITQKLKLGSVDGKYNSYTKGIVKEAKILQAHLNRLGFNAGKEDGNLGPISEKAIKRMQTYFNIQSDGYVGQVTIGFINNSCK